MNIYYLWDLPGSEGLKAIASCYVATRCKSTHDIMKRLLFDNRFIHPCIWFSPQLPIRDRLGDQALGPPLLMAAGYIVGIASQPWNMAFAPRFEYLSHAATCLVYWQSQHTQTSERGPNERRDKIVHFWQMRFFFARWPPLLPRWSLAAWKHARLSFQKKDTRGQVPMFCSCKWGSSGFRLWHLRHLASCATTNWHWHRRQSG